MPARILVINHDISYLGLIDLLLKDEGYETVLVHSNALAFEVAEEGSFNLVIIDSWIATNETGWNILLALRASAASKTVPVLLLTSGVEADIVEQLSSLENVHVLHKGTDHGVLLKTVEQLLEGEADLV
jgi:DNA-binding response OmpR family regulator